MDFMKLEELRKLQLTRLQKTIERTYNNVEFFRKRLDGISFKAGDIKSLKDIANLPFTVKTDLRDNYPYGLFAVPMKDIVRLHASSESSGKPVVAGYTRADIDMWADLMKRCFLCVGIGRGDIIQNSYAYGLFPGGLGVHYGAEAVGATVVPASDGNIKRQIMIMKDFAVTGICCTPGYFNFIVEKADEAGIDLHDLPIRTGIFGSEPWTEEMRVRIEESSGIKAYDIYGLSEIIGPGVGIECECQKGLHIFEDLFYPEIINPESGEILPDGESGELVLTTLAREAMPLIRYRTGDITRTIAETCECGRTSGRIERISTRSDDAIIIRGVNVFPSQIEAALLSVEGTSPHYNIILYSENGVDNIEVDVEITEAVFSDTIRSLEALQHKLIDAIEQTSGLRVKLKLVAPHTIQRSEGKAQRVIDHRRK